MNARDSKFVIKIMPSLADLVFLMPIVFLFARMQGAKTLLGDCDTGWHIRTGEWILANGRVPTTDLFSFSKAGQPWYAWEWLSDVIWAWMHAHGGLATVLLFSVILLSVTFSLLFRLACRHANPVLAAGFTMVAAAASSIHWLARPHLFSLLFVVLFCSALARMAEGKNSFWGVPYYALLPAATVLWTNLHGGFFVGVILIGTYGAGELIRWALSGEGSEKRSSLFAARKYLLIAFTCLAASLFNPYFYRLHVHIFEYLQDPFAKNHISEFWSLNFNHPIALFYETLLLTGVVTAVFRASKKSFVEPVAIVLWAHASLIATRNIPIFGIVVAPFAAAAAHDWLTALPGSGLADWLRKAARRFNVATTEFAGTDSLARWHVVSIAAVAVVAVLLFAPNPPANFKPEFDPQKYPAAAIATLRGDSSARIFTPDEWGDYLIYRLYPHSRVLIDGRSDFYGAEFGEKILSVRNVKYDWERTLDQLGINTVLLPPDAYLAGALKESSRWRLAYDDGVALVFKPAARLAGDKDPVAKRDGQGRDREITKLEVSDRAITHDRPKS
jgi:hypothetical protein